MNAAGGQPLADRPRRAASEFRRLRLGGRGSGWILPPRCSLCGLYSR